MGAPSFSGKGGGGGGGGLVVLSAFSRFNQWGKCAVHFSQWGVRMYVKFYYKGGGGGGEWSRLPPPPPPFWDAHECIIVFDRKLTFLVVYLLPVLTMKAHSDRYAIMSHCEC